MAHAADDNHVVMRGDGDLTSAILASLDELLTALDLERVGDDRFAVPSDTTPMFDHIFGGQLLAQAVVGAAATVERKDIHSLHAAFVKGGTPGRPIEVTVTRVRDGRSVVTRQVAVVQEGEPLLVGIASFSANAPEPEMGSRMPSVPEPHEVPLLQEWARDAPRGRGWIERPPALEMRLTEPPSFLAGGTSHTERSHWMRLPRDVGDDRLLHAALLAYASDFFLMDMIFRAHPWELGPGRVNGFSLDHAIWFHRPARFDGWHLHTQEAVAIVGDRGLARGTIHDAGGRLVASVAQEILVRPVPAR
jgi:acyl-CoA thioesterase II